MKYKILTIDFYIEAENIGNGNFIEAPCFSDYDCLIIDPIQIPEIWIERSILKEDGSRWSYSDIDKGFGRNLEELMKRRAKETQLLLEVTGGIVICFLRVKASFLNLKKSRYDERTPGRLHCYSWLPSMKIGRYSFPGIFTPIHREGREVGWVDKAHPFYQFFEGFKNEISFEAVIDDQYLIASSKPIARNKAQEVIALELRFGSAKFIFLPPFHTRVDREKLAGIMKNCIRKSLGWAAPGQKPPWIDRYELPGESEIKEGIAKLEEQIQEIEDKKRKKEEDLNQLEMLRGLLYEQGKYGLEPCVREAFRILGFNVLNPEQYEEDYDLYTKEGELSVIGEVEGTTKLVDIEKYRQLLDYVDARRLEGEKCKGILIGNALIGKEPDERDEQFTPHVIRGCKQQRFCRMTTHELFKAVRAVLLDPSDQKLREEIKQEITDCENEFKFEART